MKGEGGSRIVGLFDCFINGYVPRREEESKAGKMGGRKEIDQVRSIWTSMGESRSQSA